MVADAKLRLDQPPYLTQTITQALSLPDPPHPEPRQHESVNALLDFRAHHSPDRIAAGFTTLDTVSSKGTCTTLTYAQIQRLSVSLAHQLQTLLGEPSKNIKSPNKTPIIAVLSPSGIHLFAHILALWRLGYGVLCVAPGAPPESLANLLRTTATTTVLCHQSQREAAKSGVTAAKEGEDSIEARTVLMVDDVAPLYETPNASADEAPTGRTSNGEDVLVVMHTSGSSGLPKPIYQLHRFWSNSMASAPGADLSAFTTTPLFHGGMSDLLRSVQAGSTIFFHPTADPGALSSSAICAALKACPVSDVSYFLSVPYILELLHSDKSGQDMLQSMQLVSTGGAPLPQQLGDDMVRKEIPLVSRLGSSECGFLMSSWRDFATDKEWSHLRVLDKLGEQLLRFEQSTPPSDAKTAKPAEANTGTYELVVGADWPTKLVSNREDGSYATSDLYAPHPSKPNTWRYDSRSDDTLVLINGKKVPALLAESKLKQLPEVSEAIVFGANRAILGALVFVNSDAIASDETWNTPTKVRLLKSLQPTLAAINDSAPPHAQLAIEMVHLMSPEEVEHIPRASKGTLQRGRAYTQYNSLIDKVYTDFEEGRSLHLNSNGTGHDGVVTKQAISGTELINWIVATVKSMNGATSLDADTDFFVAGVDSIQAARIRAAIHQNLDLGESDRLLAKNVVYDYPTPTLLAEHIQQVRDRADGNATSEDREGKDLALMRDLVERYTPDFSGTPQAQNGNCEGDSDLGGVLYILTGATGGLGAQIVSDILLNRANDKDTVMLLVRAESDTQAYNRVLQSLASRGLAKARGMIVESDRTVFCRAADLSRPNCGLDADNDRRLYAKASAAKRVVTIHAAWAVNFVIGLGSFEHSQINGLHNLILLHEKLAVATSTSPSGVYQQSCFGFCSSTASILGQSGAKVYDEVVYSDPRAAVGMGYARSKWVAEHIVSRASTRSFAHNGKAGSRYAILRIGQLCSDTQHGVWNESEAWPILISLSSKLGRFPRLGPAQKLDWLAVDAAAQTVLDIVNLFPDCNPGQAKVFNVALPAPSSRKTPPANWDDLYNWLTSSSLKLEYTEPLEWTRLVREHELDDRGLLPLWEQNFANLPDPSTEQVMFSATATESASNNFTLWKDRGVDQALISKTVKRWKEIGFL